MLSELIIKTKNGMSGVVASFGKMIPNLSQRSGMVPIGFRSLAAHPLEK
jgi:hypothetical protein